MPVSVIKLSCIVFVLAVFHHKLHSLERAVVFAEAFSLLPLPSGDRISRSARLINSRERCIVFGASSSKGKINATATSSSSKKEFVNQATIQFNNKLNAIARNFDDGTSAEKAESLLRETVKNIEMGLELEIVPNVVTFTAVITAWARSSQRDASKRAEAVLDWMNELSESVDTFFEIQPNAYAYTAAISAWIRSRSPSSHQQAQRLLQTLWEKYEASQHPDLKPTARSFNLVINAIARSREPGCADQAAALLNRMEEMYLAGDDDMEPDALAFGAIINAYANSGEKGSSDRAAQILQHMESLYQLGYESVRPNTFVYNACLNAFAKSSQRDKGEKANQLLGLMEQQYNTYGDASVKPDVISYSTCINAHASSQSVEAGVEADGLVRRMTSLFLLGDASVKPNKIVYTAAIKAWVTAASVATREGKNQEVVKKAAERALDILRLMILQYLAGDEKQKPNKATFDLVCQALSNVVGSDDANDERIGEVEQLRRRIMGMQLPRRDSV